MSKDILIDAVNTIELLQAIYFDREFEFQHESDQKVYSNLLACLESDNWTTQPTYLHSPKSLEFTIKAPIELEEQDDDNSKSVYLVFQGSLSLVSESDYTLRLPFAQNKWLSREDHQALVQTFDDITIGEDEDRSTWIIEKMQQLQLVCLPFAEKYIERLKKEAAEKELAVDGDNNKPVRFLRDWIWFPMIYTREKRGDIIDWAPKYQITGFLFPGKPGAMCLEGPEKSVVQFVNDIKTISWASIPPGHRKMTSRWNEKVDCQNMKELNSQRLFQDMTEIKFDIHGQFANHNSLSMLQAWMQERECEQAFEHLFEYDNINV